MKRKGARLGQHFLTGTWAAKKLTEAAGITSEDTVLEIGPGKGALTKELLATDAHIIAIEKDTLLVEKLHETFRDKKIKIIEADIRDVEPKEIGLSAGEYILAANIPYYITGEIIRKFLSAKAQPKTMALLVQKEVAERILARDGKESILSISVKVYGTPSIAAKVSRGNFSPPPSVDSSILVVRNISKAFFRGTSEENFFAVVRAGFSSKRKFLLNNLSGVFGRELSAHAMAAAGVPEKARAEDVRLEQWGKIATAMTPSS
jgi:16S rRNA (adenine1518-N6/adenine1519-N6)-dimethyltransferase